MGFVTVAFHSLMALVCSTVRWTVIGWSSYDDVRSAGDHFIATLRHDRIVLATWFWRGCGIVVMTSRSFDGRALLEDRQLGSLADSPPLRPSGHADREPIRVPLDASAATIAESQDRLQTSLDALCERADGWWTHPRE